MRAPTIRLIALAVLLAMVAAACGDTEGTEPAPPAPASDEAQAASTTTLPVAPDAVAPPTSGATIPSEPLPTTTPENETTTTTVPETTTTATPPAWGEPFDDMYGPAAGEEIFVIGVRHDDVLNVRAGPGTEHAIVTALHPWGSATATGENRILASDAVWREVTTEGTTGWAHSAYLSRLGRWETDEWAMTQLGDASAPTILGLGEMVIDIYVRGPSEEDLPEECQPAVELTLAPRWGNDGDELGYDVIGFCDDSVLGVRVHIFGSTTEAGDYYVVDIQARPMCWRGISVGSDGLCI